MNNTYTPTVIQLTYAPQYRAAGQTRSLSITQLADIIASQRAVDPIELSRQLGRAPEPKEIKGAGPIVYWATWGSPNPTSKQRSLPLCTGITAIWMDYDGQGGNTLTRPQFEARVREVGVECLIWNTYSADARQVNFRAVFPLSKAIHPTQHPSALAGLLRLLGPEISPPAKESETASQGTYISPRMGGVGTEAHVRRGTPIDQLVDISQPLPAAPIESGNGAGLGFDKMFNEVQKELFRRAIPHIDSHPRFNWLKVCGAAIRGWGIRPEVVINPALQSDSQKNIIQIVEAWCRDNEIVPPSAKSKYQDNCLAKNAEVILNGSKGAGIPAVVKLAEEYCFDLTPFLDDDGSLIDLLENCRRAPEAPPEVVVSKADLEKASTENEIRIAERMAGLNEHDRALENLIHDMPDCNSRDYITSIATKGRIACYAELTPDIEFSIPPALAVLGGAQLADTVIANRAWLNAGELGPLAGNLYILWLAGSGTGKSQTLTFLGDVLRNSGYGDSLTLEKSHSSAGFFNNFIRRGPVVFQASDEAKEWFATMDVTGGGMVANQTTLNSIILRLFNESRVGGSIDPQNRADDRQGGKIKQAEKINHPHVNILFIGTHDMVPYLSEKLVNDGYLARFIILLTKEKEDVEAQLQRHLRRQLGDGTGANTYAAGVAATASYLKQLDIDLAAACRGLSVDALTKLGSEFLDGEDGQVARSHSELYRELQVNRVNEDRWASLLTLDQEICSILYDAVLPLARLASTHETLRPIANREMEKIERLALTFTLINDPAANRLCPAMTRYAAKVITLLQKAWVDKLVTADVTLIAKSNTFAPLMDKLKLGMNEEGILFKSPGGVSARVLRDQSRVWRDLMRGLTSEVLITREDSVKVLESLGIVRVKSEGRRGWTFFHPEHAPKLEEQDE